MSSLDRLREVLAQRPPGPLALDAIVTDLLASAWPALPGGDAEGMQAGKLFGRIEDLMWAPPHLTFRIERHGATVNGSSRAELHAWTVDVDAARATCATGRFRQLRPAAPRLDVRPMAAALAAAITTGADDPRLRWVDADTVRLRIGAVIPDEGPAQTVQGRRRRLRAALTVSLASVGWEPAGTPNTYHRAAIGSSASAADAFTDQRSPARRARHDSDVRD